MLSLDCVWGYVGSWNEGDAFERLVHNFFSYTFVGRDFLDIISLISLFIFYKSSKNLKNFKTSLAIGFIALAFSFTYISCRAFCSLNSSRILFDSAYSVLITVFQTVGYSILIFHILKKLITADFAFLLTDTIEKKSIVIFFVFGALCIFFVYLVFILINYPGSTMDAYGHYSSYFGIDNEGHLDRPILTTLIMGSTFSLGRTLGDPNFGMVMYQLFQSFVASLVFTNLICELMKVGLKKIWCFMILAYYSLLPMWGTYAQFVQKDFIFAIAVTLYMTLLFRLLLYRNISIKNLVFLCAVVFCTSLLRESAIYLLLFPLAIIAIKCDKVLRKKLLLMSIIVFSLSTFANKATGSSNGIFIDNFGLMFQQTGRYVRDYDAELTDEERRVIEENWGGNELDYDPVISDPMKLHYIHKDFDGYFKIWIKMFAKHPFCYWEAFMNFSYGYLAPVEPNISAWIMHQDYRGDLKELLGIERAEVSHAQELLAYIVNVSMYVPFVKWLETPGMYSWMVIAMLILLILRGKKGQWVFVLYPVMLIAVCCFSPLANATRYYLSAIAASPIILFGSFILINSNRTDSDNNICMHG